MTHWYCKKKLQFNPLPAMSDRCSISPLNFNFSIKKQSDKNKDKYRLGDYYQTQYQILITHIIGTV